MEVMVALAIVASMMVTLVYTTSYNLDVAGRHEALTVATMLARDKMTAIRRNPREELKEKKGNFPEPFDEFAYAIEVKERSVFVVLFNVGVTEINVTVTGRNETVSLRKILQRGKVSG
jgi:type II secretory pathway pseudopilin PulG